MEKRKLDRMKMLTANGEHSETNLEWKIRERMHANVCHLKQMKRQNVILSMLREKLVERRSLKASVGGLYFFEHDFANKSDIDKRYSIKFSSPSLSLAADKQDGEALDVDGSRLILGGGSHAIVPFKYRNVEMPSSRREGKCIEVVNVSLVCEETGNIESQMELTAELYPCVIEKTITLKVPTKRILQHRFILEESNTSRRDSEVPHSVLSSDPRVAAKIEDSPNSDQGRDVVMKYNKGTKPGAREFYLFFYGDKSYQKLLRSWKLVVEYFTEVDINGMLGQTTSSSIVVEGVEPSQRVKCFSSHPDELQVICLYRYESSFMQNAEPFRTSV